MYKIYNQNCNICIITSFTAYRKNVANTAKCALSVDAHDKDGSNTQMKCIEVLTMPSMGRYHEDIAFCPVHCSHFKQTTCLDMNS